MEFTLKAGSGKSVFWFVDPLPSLFGFTHVVY